MKVSCENNNIILNNVEDFNLHHIFECGQAFRWNKVCENTYIGVAKGHVLKISQDKEKVILFDTTFEDFENVWFDYFDFATDYSKIKEHLSSDEVLRKAIPFGNGIRILKQDLWEVVVSFIISASNNIPRIKKIVELLCENFGEPVFYDNTIFYTFPGSEILYKLQTEDLSVIRAGFRDKYILDAAKKFAEGEISFEMLKNLDTKDAKNKLMSIFGVGSKVADCILLFGLSRTDSFPVDVWVKRIMETLYLKRETKNSEIERFAKDTFGELCGLAQQYLFFYARENLR